jgi:hypothetical protein
MSTCVRARGNINILHIPFPCDVMRVRYTTLFGVYEQSGSREASRRGYSMHGHQSLLPLDGRESRNVDGLAG